VDGPLRSAVIAGASRRCGSVRAVASPGRLPINRREVPFVAVFRTVPVRPLPEAAMSGLPGRAQKNCVRAKSTTAAAKTPAGTASGSLRRTALAAVKAGSTATSTMFA
jgi:hypothetical protein